MHATDEWVATALLLGAVGWFGREVGLAVRSGWL